MHSTSNTADTELITRLHHYNSNNPFLSSGGATVHFCLSAPARCPRPASPSVEPAPRPATSNPPSLVRPHRTPAAASPAQARSGPRTHTLLSLPGRRRRLRSAHVRAKDHRQPGSRARTWTADTGSLRRRTDTRPTPPTHPRARPGALGRAGAHRLEGRGASVSPTPSDGDTRTFRLSRLPNPHTSDMLTLRDAYWALTKSFRKNTDTMVSLRAAPGGAHPPGPHRNLKHSSPRRPALQSVSLLLPSWLSHTLPLPSHFV